MREKIVQYQLATTQEELDKLAKELEFYPYN